MTKHLSVFILTCNEEVNIEQALRSLRGAVSAVFVIDSGSTDLTVQIAESLGAKVLHNPWPGYAKQVNWALENCPFETEWILRLDADEALTPELVQELAATLQNAPSDVGGYYLKRRFFFMGRWIRHGGYYPVWILRLFRRGHAYCEDVPFNEHFVITHGSTSRLKHDLIHNDHKGLKDWLLKHVKYASLDVERRTKEANNPGEKRQAATSSATKQWMRKNIFMNIPMFVRPLVYFVYRYFFRLGFLDGIPGLIFHFLQAFWLHFYVDSLMWEVRLKQTSDSSSPKPIGNNSVKEA